MVTGLDRVNADAIQRIEQREPYATLQGKRYDICISTPHGFWRWTQLMDAIRDYLEERHLSGEVDSLSGPAWETHDPFSNRMVRHETNLPYVNGCFGVFIFVEGDTELYWRDVCTDIHHLVTRYHGPPTEQEGLDALRAHFAKWGELCEECGLPIDHHESRLAEGGGWSDNQEHWGIVCLHPITYQFGTEEWRAEWDRRENAYYEGVNI